MSALLTIILTIAGTGLTLYALSFIPAFRRFLLAYAVPILAGMAAIAGFYDTFIQDVLVRILDSVPFLDFLAEKSDEAVDWLCVTVSGWIARLWYKERKESRAA